jgi:hypothetical protein
VCCDPFDEDWRDYDAGVGRLIGVTAVATDDPEHRGPDLFAQIDRSDDVHGDALAGISAANGQDENSISRIEPGTDQPAGE